MLSQPYKCGHWLSGLLATFTAVMCLVSCSRHHSTAAKTQISEFLSSARGGDLQQVKVLLYSDPDLVFSTDTNAVTALHWAALEGHMDIAELLLAYKANANAKSNAGMTPLHWAAFRGHLDLVELLLANKADVNAKADDGQTPLGMAMRQKHDDVAELLRQHGGHE